MKTLNETKAELALEVRNAKLRDLAGFSQHIVETEKVTLADLADVRADINAEIEQLKADLAKLDRQEKSIVEGDQNLQTLVEEISAQDVITDEDMRRIDDQIISNLLAALAEDVK